MNPREQAPCGLSFHGLTMESMDPRIESEDDNTIELSCADLIGASMGGGVRPEDDSGLNLSCSDLIGASMDPRVKPEDDVASFVILGHSSVIPGPMSVIPGLTGNPGVHA